MRSVRMVVLAVVALLAACIGSVQVAQADAVCRNSGFLAGRAITDLCWDCFFPIQIIGVPIGFPPRGPSMLPDDTAAPVCICPGRFGLPSFGLTVGYWNPEHLIETVHTPWCSPMLGVTLIKTPSSTFTDIMAKAQMGGYSPPGTGAGQITTSPGFQNFHWIKFPGGALVDMLMDVACARGGFDIDYAYFSEIDPTWSSDVLSMYTAPEGHVFSQVFARWACVVDGVAATVRKPIMGDFWCAGSWGMVYPMDGTTTPTGNWKSQMLAAVKGQAHMHRLGLAHLSYGNLAVCADLPWFTLPHQQYQYQNFWPNPDRIHALWAGTSEYWMGSGMARTIPLVAEDRLIMAWQFRNCCMTFW